MNVLLPGERVLWSGRPGRVVPRGLDWYRLAFGLVWISVVVGSASPWPENGVPYVGLGFAAFGFAVSSGPVIGRLWVMRRVVYAVTDRRVVVVDRVSGRTRASAYLAALAPPVTRTRTRDDGVGTVTFGEPVGFLSSAGHQPSKGQSPQVQIELVAVPDAERVRDVVAQAQSRQA